jgi:lipoate-protein ligase A
MSSAEGRGSEPACAGLDGPKAGRVSRPAEVAQAGTGIRPRWTQVLVADAPLDGEVELQWLAAALDGEARAVLWFGARGLVAPTSYRRHASLADAARAFEAEGWPLRLRRSGGGLVPQGPGVLNLTLAYPCDAAPGLMADAVYHHLCDVLARALRTLNIQARPRMVEGSFCDGRYNLAVGERKIAGTAQYWRRAGDRHAVLAHALLLVDADIDMLTNLANRFEAALRSERRYRADALTSVARERHHHDESPQALQQRVIQALVAALA